MTDDLDLRGIDHRHEPDPQFRAALQRRVAAIVAGADPGSVTESYDLAAIDLEPTTATFAPNRTRRRAVAAVLAAAAAVAAIAVVAIRDDDATPADQPSPAVTVPPTSPPLPLSSSHGQLEPGTYFVDEVAGTPTPRIFATLGAGWSKSSDGWHINKRDDPRTFDEMARDANSLGEMSMEPYLQHDVGVMEFSHPVAVYLDACHWEAGNHPGPLDTVDGLVAALSEQRGWAQVTAPSDISVDGYVGKAFQRTAPADMSDCSTRNYGMRTGEPGVNSDFRSWTNPDEPAGWAGFYYEPGWIETLWVLDLDGTIVIISTGVWPEPSAGADADFAADVLDSIRIDPVGNPLVDIRSRLVDQGDVELFRMNSDTERYWRLTTLAEFDGRTFRLPSRGLDLLDDAAANEPQGRTIRQQIQILALTDKMVPAAADVFQVAPNTDMRLNPDTGTLLSLSDLVSGEQFTIVSVEPDITVDELRAATTDNPPDEIFLELPDNVPVSVYDTAAEVTAGAATDYDRLIVLQNWFRTFEYSTEVQSGHGNNAIENFLQIRKGYCEQFAATFAVMARTLGIPSRVAVGYTPGRLRSDGWYSVLGRNSHTWPEIWFDGIGWVDFEPTPQRGIPGAQVYTGVPAEQDEIVPDAATAEPGAVTLPPTPTPTTVFSPPTTIRPRTDG